MIGYWMKRYIFKQPVITLPRASFTTKLSNTPITLKPLASSTYNVPKSSQVSSVSSVSCESSSSKALQPITPVKKTLAPYQVMPVDKWRDGVLAAAAQHKYTITPALWDKLTTFPSQPLCVSHVPSNYIKDFSRVMTIMDCIKKGMPMGSVILLAQNMFTTTGEGVTFTQNLMAHTRFFENLIPDATQRYNAMQIDYTKLLPWKDLVTLPFFYLTNSHHISIKTQNTLGYELWAMAQVNRHLVHNRLGVAFKNTSPWVDEDMRFDPVDPFPYEASLQHCYNYYDQTQNEHADFVLVLAEPVMAKGFPKPIKKSSSGIPPAQEPQNHPRNWVAFDLKFGQIRPTYNTVKACQNDSDLVKNLLTMHRSLTTYLETKRLSYSALDDAKAQTVIAALKNNLTTYMNTKNLSAFQATYHQVYDNNTSFFLKNQIGFNFIVSFPLSDLRIAEEHVTFFSARYIHHATVPGTLVSHFAEIIAKQNPSSMTPGSHVTAFVHELFKHPNV